MILVSTSSQPGVDHILDRNMKESLPFVGLQSLAVLCSVTSTAKISKLGRRLPFSNCFRVQRVMASAERQVLMSFSFMLSQTVRVIL